MHPNYKEFTVGGHVYRCGKMDARTQFHVSRRILPVLVGLGKGGESSLGQMQGAAEALASLTDEDCNYVLSKCMVTVQRQLPGDTGWANTWSPAADRPMMDDIDMVAMLQIVAEVISHNLQNFTQGLPSGILDLMKSPSDTNL